MPLTRADLDRLRRQLGDRSLLFGARRRRGAVSELARDASAQAVPLLATALHGRDAQVSEMARVALSSLTDAAAVDAFCQAWAGDRSESLTRILVSRGYQATRPVEVRVLTACKLGRAEQAGQGSGVLPPLLSALADRDPQVARTARRALGQLSSPEAVDAFCAAWAKTRRRDLDELLVARGYLARQPVRLRVLCACRLGQAELAASMGEAAVPDLIASLTDRDATVRKSAGAALLSLSDPGAREALARAWATDRREELAAILVRQQYVPPAPDSLRVLVACKIGQPAQAVGGAATAQALLAARVDKDATVRANAERALLLLTDRAAVDVVCAAWAEQRTPELEQILKERRYVASQPAHLRVLTACKVGQADVAARGGAEVVPALLAALEDADTEIRAAAGTALASPSDQSAVDALCELVIQEARPGLAELAVRKQWGPADASRRALFLLLTGQTEACCLLDPDCEHLRGEYEQADEPLRRRIRQQALASGEDRLARALTGVAGVEVRISLLMRNRNCAELLECLKSSSYRQIVRILDFLAEQRWQPAGGDDRDFLAELQALRARVREAGDARADFEGLLANDRLAGRSAQELRGLASQGEPRQRAGALLALAARDPEAASPLVATSLTDRNWELRLAAGLAAAFADPEVLGTALTELMTDRNHWVASAGTQGLILSLRGLGTARDLHRLEQARSYVEQQLRAAPGQATQADLVLQLLLVVLRRSIVDAELTGGGVEAGTDVDVEIVGGP